MPIKKKPEKPVSPSEVPGPIRNPEIDPDNIPESPVLPDEEPDVIPDENPFETPPTEVPAPGEGP